MHGMIPLQSQALDTLTAHFKRVTHELLHDGFAVIGSDRLGDDVSNRDATVPGTSTGCTRTFLRYVATEQRRVCAWLIFHRYHPYEYDGTRYNRRTDREACAATFYVDRRTKRTAAMVSPLIFLRKTVNPENHPREALCSTGGRIWRFSATSEEKGMSVETINEIIEMWRAQMRTDPAAIEARYLAR